MACNQTLSGLTNDCATSMGGIVRAYIINWDAVTGVTDSEGVITAITLGESAKFKEYYFKRNTGSFTSTLNVDAANGVNYVSTDIVLQFTRMETAKRIEIAALAVNEVALIVLDANGKYWFFGKDNPVTATAGTGQTGTAVGDGNFYQITLQDTSSSFPFEVEVGGDGVDLSTIVG